MNLSGARERFPKAEKGKAANGKGKPNQAEILIEIGQSAELFHDGEDCYATVAVTGHCETYRIGSRGFRRWLLNLTSSKIMRVPTARR
jgi:hypothetical protein